MEKVNSLWKIAAIIMGVIILIALGLMLYGTKIIAAEENCIQYCYDKESESYDYNYETRKCDCYVGENIVESVRT